MPWSWPKFVIYMVNPLSLHQSLLATIRRCMPGIDTAWPEQLAITTIGLAPVVLAPAVLFLSPAARVFFLFLVCLRPFLFCLLNPLFEGGVPVLYHFGVSLEEFAQMGEVTHGHRATHEPLGELGR